MLNLITTYNDSIEVICAEIANCEAEDQIVFSLYIWEPGPSSIRVLQELERAVQRNVKIIFDVDHSYVVKFARFVEKTETFMGELTKFEKKYPKNVSFSSGLYPNHKKYYLFKRKNGLSTLIFGSMNLGDRFSDWKDLLVVFKDSEVGEYIFNRFILGKETKLSDSYPVKIIANEPERKIFQVENALAELLSNNAYTNYQVITPYIDLRGLMLLKKALEHKAKIQLVVPARANIYQNSNMRALKIFSRFNGVTIYLFNKMIHAKLILATGENKKMLCIGSANLKKKSFDKLGEFNGFTNDGELNQQMSSEMKSIIKDCKIFEPTPYKKIMSRIEEFLG